MPVDPPAGKPTQRPGPGPDARSAGDAARDRRDWAEAEACYRAHLGRVPRDQPIWIQLGHALKEQGKLAVAEAAYREGIALAPELPDPHLQLGHLQKLRGRPGAAVAAYAEALRLAPVAAAHAELLALGAAPLAEPLWEGWRSRRAADCLYLEITDLLVYLRDHTAVSGIQRVQLGLLGHVLDLPAEARAHFAFAQRRGDDPRLWLLPPEHVAALRTLLAGAAVPRAALTALLDAAETAASPARPVAGQALVVLGAFWVGGSAVPALAALKAAGLRLGALIYDLIPLTHPEFCDEVLVAEFTRALADGLGLFDVLLTISDHTGAELRRLLARHGLPALPVETVPLAHELKPGRAGAPDWTPAIAALRGRDFVLCVCTIEVRKNHAYLFALWKRLIEEGVNVPDLVLVGRHGWRVEDLLAQMRATGFLGGRIRLLHGLTDAELALLYDHCLFTVFPSFAEGWGLPVGESLAHGKLCLASETTAIPEVAGELALYFDPLNLHSGLAAVRRLLADRGLIARQEALIRERFRPRGWDDVGADFLATARRLLAAAALAPARPVAPLLPAGEPVRLAGLTSAIPPPGYLARPLRLLLAEGWTTPAGDGAWLAAPGATLRFRSDLDEGTEVLVMLELRLGELAAGTLLEAGLPGGAPRRIPLPGGQRDCRVRLRGAVDSAGLVTVTLRLLGEGELALLGLAHVAADDWGARQEMLERLLVDLPG